MHEIILLGAFFFFVKLRFHYKMAIKQANGKVTITKLIPSLAIKS